MTRYNKESGHFGGFVDSDAAGGGTSPMVVSSMMNYGSYSGADIKVIVHYPEDKAGIRAIEKQKAELQKQIEKEKKAQAILGGSDLGYEIDPEGDLAFLQKRYDDAVVKSTGASFQYQKLLYEEMSELDKNLQKIKEAPTSKVLAEIQTFSWSVFREKDPVRSLGSVYARGFTRGGRTISGSMVFTVFYEHVLHEVLKLNLRYKNTGTTDTDPYLATTMIPDQLPPLDITLLFANEYGAISTMSLYGVEFFNEGGTFSIEDIYSETTMQYVARDLDPMRSVAQREIDNQGVSEDWQATASDMLQEKRYVENGHVYRRNPFI